MTVKNRIVLAAAAAALVLVTAVPAGAATDSDVALDDADLAGWTQPVSPGTGRIPPDESEASETAPSFDGEAFTPSAVAGPGDVVISGTGWSHGIGMSQYGAYAQALAGRDHARILASYYPGAKLATGVDDEPLWVNLKQEAVKVRLTAKKIAVNPVPVTVTRGGETLTLGDGQSVTIAYTGVTGGVRQCTFSGPGYTSPDGPCMIDLEWDGEAASPTMRVVIDRVWYAGTGAAGEACTHRVSPYTLECAYSRGVMHIRPDDMDEPDDTGFNVVIEIDRDEYVLGIGEMPYGWPTEALETQAVTSRTFASYIADYRSSPEDRQWCWCNVYDRFPDQVYLGWGFGTRRWVDAVRSTNGEVVTYGGKAVGAFFGSSNGGATENNDDIWPGNPIPYLRANIDFWSRHPANTPGRWDVPIPASRFASTLGFTSVDSVEIVARYESGTPSDIVVTGTAGGVEKTRHFTGVSIQSAFHLRSPHLNQIRGPFDPGEPAVTRRGGADRYETAVSVSWANFATRSHPSVVVVRGDLFPDALSAAPLARSVSGPVLLTGSTSLPGVVAAELDRLDLRRIYVVGGTAAVSDGVAQELTAYAPVTRIAGANRYATAAEVSRELASGGADTVFIASGTGFADAVSGSALAAARNAPLLLTSRDSLPGPTADELDRIRPREIVVLGGSVVVSPAVIRQLERYADKVTVLAGATRYDTSAAISRWGHPGGADHVYLATGAAFADALAGAAVAGAEDGPILLVSDSSIPGSVRDEIRHLDPSRITLLGGPAAISYAVQDSVDDL